MWSCFGRSSWFCGTKEGCETIFIFHFIYGHEFKLRHRSFRLLRRKAAFSVRLPISWNKLPMEMVNAPTLNTFKRLLDLAWFSLFPSLPWLPCSFNSYFTWFEAPNSAVMFDQYIWSDLIVIRPNMRKSNLSSCPSRFRFVMVRRTPPTGIPKHWGRATRETIKSRLPVSLLEKIHQTTPSSLLETWSIPSLFGWLTPVFVTPATFRWKPNFVLVARICWV